MIIRNEKVTDIDAIIKYEKLTAQTPGFLVSIPDELTPVYYQKLIASSDIDLIFFIVENEKQVVGHAYFLPMSLKALSHVYRLTIVIHPNHVNQGIGKLLMDTLMKAAREKDKINKIESLVRSSNKRAIHLYEKYGFKTEGILKKRIRLSESEFLDDITMGWFSKAIS